MNYCIVAFAIVLVIAGLTWIFDGRKNYHGPQLDVDAMLNGEVEGLGGLDNNVGNAPAAEMQTEKEKHI